MFYLAKKVGKIWRCSCWEKGNFIIINHFKYGPTLKIWPYPLSLSLYSKKSRFKLKSYRTYVLSFLCSKPNFESLTSLDHQINIHQIKQLSKLQCLQKKKEHCHWKIQICRYFFQILFICNGYLQVLSTFSQSAVVCQPSWVRLHHWVYLKASKYI